MIDASKYTITVRNGLFDGEECFEARIAELPDVAEYADSFAEAYSLAIDTIQTTAECFAEQGKPMPPPIIPADEGVSLNQHLTNILNYYAGYANAEKSMSHPNR